MRDLVRPKIEFFHSGENRKVEIDGKNKLGRIFSTIDLSEINKIAKGRISFPFFISGRRQRVIMAKPIFNSFKIAKVEVNMT